VKPDRLSIVLVGDAAKFVGQLKAQGFNDFERIPIEQLDLTAPSLRKGGTAEAPAPAPQVRSGSAAALAVVNKIAEAKGGLAALRALKTLDVQADVTISGAGPAVKMQTRNLIAYPDKYRVEANAPGGKMVQVFAGAQAWVETPAGVVDADAETRSDYQQSAARDLVPLIVSAIDGVMPVLQLPDETVGGQPAFALQFGLKVGGPLVMLVDPKTYEIRGLRYPSDLAPNAPQAVETYEDYRTVSGLRVAFRAHVERDGLMIDRVITSVSMNGVLPVTAFVRKAA
jgi:hypothetical protein